MSQAQQTEEQHIASVQKRIGRKEFIILIAALMATNAIAIDIMLPAMNEIGHSLNAVGDNSHQLIIFAYLFGFGISQLFFGPISDRFGRRKPLLFGLVFYIIASFACTFSFTFTGLLIMRVIQGIGAAATRVLTVSIVRDLYGGRLMAEIMSIVMMIFMVVPVLAPTFGQVIMLGGHWQLIFAAIGIFGFAVTIWVYYRLPETLYETRPLDFKTIRSSFTMVLTNRVALCYTLAFSVALGALFAALGTAQDIYDGIYKLGPWFPIVFAIVACFQALSSFMNAKLVVRFGMRRISHTMTLIFLGFSFIWWGLSLIVTGPIPLPIFLSLFIVIMFAFGALGANFNAMAMEPLGKVAGTASSVFGFLQTVIGAGLGMLIGQTFNGSITPIAAGYTLMGFVALILVLIAEKGKLFQASPTRRQKVIIGGPEDKA